MSCKKCGKPHQTKWHSKMVWQVENKDKRNAITRKWYASHREQVTEIRRKYRKTPNGKAAVLRAIKRYEAKNPNRRNAWVKAKNIKLKPCEVCGKEPTHRHHPDIKKPLEVQFLCPLHHKEVHMV